MTFYVNLINIYCILHSYTWFFSFYNADKCLPILYLGSGLNSCITWQFKDPKNTLEKSLNRYYMKIQFQDSVKKKLGTSAMEFLFFCTWRWHYIHREQTHSAFIGFWVEVWRYLASLAFRL